MRYSLHRKARISLIAKEEVPTKFMKIAETGAGLMILVSLFIIANFF